MLAAAIASMGCICCLEIGMTEIQKESQQQVREVKKEPIDGLITSIRWFWEVRAPFIQLLGTIILSVLSILVSRYVLQDGLIIFSLLLSIFLIVVGTIMSIKHEEDRQALKDQKDNLFDEMQRLRKVPVKLLTNFLIYLANELEFTERYRISLYIHRGNSFFRLSRFSRNPNYNRTGRKLYPEDEGCLADAWERGASVVQLPDPKNWEEYKKELEDKHNIDGDVADKLTMKSRSYVGIRLTDPRTNAHRGVVVFESTKATGVTLNTVRAVLDKQKEDELAKYVSEFLPWLPKAD